jgi:DNA-binding transcriptional LysR family regulator
MLGILGTLSLKELEVLADVPRFSSLRALARSRNAEAAQVTRTLQRLEQLFGKTFLERGPHGTRVTEDGIRIAAVAQKVIDCAQELLPDTKIGNNLPTLTLGSRGFLNFSFAAPLVACLNEKEKESGKVRFAGIRFLDMSPEELKIAEHKRLLHIALHLGPMEWTAAWESFHAGKLLWEAYVRMGHPLLKQGPVSLEALMDWEFVAPSYWVGSEIREGDDGFPIPLRSRKIRVYCQSAMAALEVARTSDAIVFAPKVLNDLQLKSGQLSRLLLIGTEKCFQDVYVSVRTDVVPKSLKDAFVSTLQKMLS